MGISTLVLHKDTKDDLVKNATRVAPMHRVKGLDFDHVVIASVNDGIVPLGVQYQSSEELIKEEGLLRERSLLFVSATRAKKTLLITSYGERSSFIV
jgi:superfamily I DNA/RNA helicase